MPKANKPTTLFTPQTQDVIRQALVAAYLIESTADKDSPLGRQAAKLRDSVSELFLNAKPQYINFTSVLRG